MSKRIRKAVFPVAGLGTRFLPATKTVPKEMLPIIDRPLIQYAVDEAIEAGCDLILMPDDLDAALQALRDAAADGTLTEARIDESVLRILTLKAKAGLLG